MPLIEKIRAGLGNLWWYAAVAFVINRLGDIVNVFTGLWLVPRYLPANELGAVTPLISVASFIALPLSIVLLPAGKFLSAFAARKEYGKVKALLSDAVAVSLLFAVFVSIWLFFTGDAILERMHLSDRRILIPMAGFAIITCIDPILQSAQRALLCFKGMLISGLIAPYVRLVTMLILLAPLGALGYLSAQLMMMLTGVVIGIIVLCRVFKNLGRRESYKAHWKEMLNYSLPLLIMVIVGGIQAPVESFVIRHRLPEEVSAGYYYATAFGAIPGYATSALMFAFWPIVSNKFEKGEATQNLLLQSLLFNFALGSLILLVLAAVIPYVFEMPGPWANYREYSKYVWQAGLLIVIKGIVSTFLTYQGAVRRFVYVRYLVPLYLAEALVVYSLPGWSAFKPYLPDSIWSIINNSWTLSLQSILSLIIFFNGLFLIAVLTDCFIFMKKVRTEARNP